MINKKRLLEMLVDFAEVWPREVTPKLVNLYADVLKGYPAEDIETAFRQVLATNRYKFPDPSAFIEALGGYTHSGVQTKNPMREFRADDPSFNADPKEF